MTDIKNKRFDIVSEFKNQYGRIVTSAIAINFTAQECKTYMDIVKTNALANGSTISQRAGKTYIDGATDNQTAYYIVDHAQDAPSQESADQEDHEEGNPVKDFLLYIFAAIGIIMLFIAMVSK